MIDIYTYLLFLLTGLPILMGIGAWFAIWMKEEFYQDPFYDDYED